MQTETGNKIVDWLMDVALNDKLPMTTRREARNKLTACALRTPSQAVEDVIGQKH